MCARRFHSGIGSCRRTRRYQCSYVVALADAMPGVGLKRAKAIVEYRRQHGPFDRLEDLTEVYGIGEKLLDKSRDRLMVR